MPEVPTPSSVKNPKRRLLLTFGVTGVVAFILGKIFGDAGERLLSQHVDLPGAKRTEFQNFTLTETKGEIVLTDKSGEEIFIVEKER